MTNLQIAVWYLDCFEAEVKRLGAGEGQDIFFNAVWIKVESAVFSMTTRQNDLATERRSSSMKFCTCSSLNWAMWLVGVKSLAQLRSKKKSINLCLAGARKLLCNCIAKLSLFVQCVSPLTLPFPFYAHSCHWPKLNGPSAGPTLPYSFTLIRHGGRSLVCVAASLTAAVCVLLGVQRCVQRGRPQGARVKMGQRPSSAQDLDQTPEVLSTISGGRCLYLFWQVIHSSLFKINTLSISLMCPFLTFDQFFFPHNSLMKCCMCRLIQTHACLSQKWSLVIWRIYYGYSNNANNLDWVQKSMYRKMNCSTLLM